MSSNGDTTLSGPPTDPSAVRKDGIASRIAERTNEGFSSASDRLGDGVERTAQGLRGVSDKVARRLDGASEYLHETDAKSLGADLMGVVKRHPKTTALVGIGIGFLIYRMLR